MSFSDCPNSNALAGLIVALHQFAEIIEGRGIGPLLFRFGEMRFVHVAKHHDATVGGGIPGVAFAHATATAPDFTCHC